MKKVIRDGKVAVLYSPGFGAGWTTWGAPPELLFDPEIVALVEASKKNKIPGLIKKRGFSFYAKGALGLKIMWLDQGTLFRVSEYDGEETIETINDIEFIKA